MSSFTCREVKDGFSFIVNQMNGIFYLLLQSSPCAKSPWQMSRTVRPNKWTRLDSTTIYSIYIHFLTFTLIFITSFLLPLTHLITYLNHDVSLYNALSHFSEMYATPSLPLAHWFLIISSLNTNPPNIYFNIFISTKSLIHTILLYSLYYCLTVSTFQSYRHPLFTQNNTFYPIFSYPLQKYHYYLSLLSLLSLIIPNTRTCISRATSSLIFCVYSYILISISRLLSSKSIVLITFKRCSRPFILFVRATALPL